VTEPSSPAAAGSPPSSPLTTPEPADTTDLRTGPEINSALLAVLPLVGRWSGLGNGSKPATGEEFRYAQRVSFAHDGRPFLSYESRTWLLNADGSVLRQAFRENGFLRMGSGTDELELVLATAVGIVEVFTGLAGQAGRRRAAAVRAHRRETELRPGAGADSRRLSPAPQRHPEPGLKRWA